MDGGGSVLGDPAGSLAEAGEFGTEKVRHQDGGNVGGVQMQLRTAEGAL
jgi:hypothetical protein